LIDWNGFRSPAPPSLLDVRGYVFFFHRNPDQIRLASDLNRLYFPSFTHTTYPSIFLMSGAVELLLLWGISLHQSRKAYSYISRSPTPPSPGMDDETKQYQVRTDAVFRAGTPKDIHPADFGKIPLRLLIHLPISRRPLPMPFANVSFWLEGSQSPQFQRKRHHPSFSVRNCYCRS